MQHILVVGAGAMGSQIAMVCALAGYDTTVTDVADEALTPVPANGESVVRVDPPQIELDDVAALHVDVPSSEEATKRAIGAIDAADLGDEDAELAVGDALDNFLAFYDPSELPVLIELL